MKVRTTPLTPDEYGTIIFESRTGGNLLTVDYVAHPFAYAAHLSLLISGQTAGEPGPSAIDADDARPIFLQLANALHDRIASGELDPRSVFPSETALAEEYGISRRTVRRAVAALLDDELVRGALGLDALVNPDRDSARPQSR